MTPSEGFEAWFYPKGILGQYIKFDSEMARKAWLAACAWQRAIDADLARSTDIPNESCEYELVLRQAMANAILAKEGE